MIYKDFWSVGQFPTLFQKLLGGYKMVKYTKRRQSGSICWLGYDFQKSQSNIKPHNRIFVLHMWQITSQLFLFVLLLSWKHETRGRLRCWKCACVLKPRQSYSGNIYGLCHNLSERRTDRKTASCCRLVFAVWAVLASPACGDAHTLLSNRLMKSTCVNWRHLLDTKRHYRTDCATR